MRQVRIGSREKCRISCLEECQACEFVFSQKCFWCVFHPLVPTSEVGFVFNAVFVRDAGNGRMVLVDLLYTMTTHVPWVCHSSRKENEGANEVCFRDAHSHRMCSIVMRYLHFTVYSRSSRNICIPCPKYIVPERLICPGRIVRSSSNKFTNMFDQKKESNPRKKAN